MKASDYIIIPKSLLKNRVTELRHEISKTKSIDNLTELTFEGAKLLSALSEIQTIAEQSKQLMPLIEHAYDAATECYTRNGRDGMPPFNMDITYFLDLKEEKKWTKEEYLNREI